MRIITILALSAATLLAAGCGVSAVMAESEKETQALVEKYLDNHEIYIEVDTILSSRGDVKHTTDGYFLKIKDGVANSYLPFYGESYMTPYGGSYKPEIQYEDCPVEVYEEVDSKGKHTWTFEGKSGDTKVTTQIEFFTSGSATITCSSANRSVMNYRGTVMKDERKIKKDKK